MRRAPLHYVFVYGSLKRGFQNHSAMIPDATLVKADAVTAKADYHMVSFGLYPAVLSMGIYKVTGEVYAIDGVMLDVLDMLEGRMYQRRLIEIDGMRRRAWIYILREYYNEGTSLESVQIENRIATWLNPVDTLIKNLGGVTVETRDAKLRELLNS